MTEAVFVPAGVIQPRGLLLWLSRRRDEMKTEASRAWDDDDEMLHSFYNGRAEAFSEVIQHISFGGEV